MSNMESDAEYFTRRSVEAKAAALAAASREARKAHLEMAERYSDLARAIMSSNAAWGSLADVAA